MHGDGRIRDVRLVLASTSLLCHERIAWSPRSIGGMAVSHHAMLRTSEARTSICFVRSRLAIGTSWRTGGTAAPLQTNLL